MNVYIESVDTWIGNALLLTSLVISPQSFRNERNACQLFAASISIEITHLTDHSSFHVAVYGYYCQFLKT